MAAASEKVPGTGESFQPPLRSAEKSPESGKEVVASQGPGSSMQARTVVGESSLRNLQDFMASFKSDPIPRHLQTLLSFVQGEPIDLDTAEIFSDLAISTEEFFKFIFERHHLRDHHILMAVGGTGTGKSSCLGHLQGFPVVKIEKEHDIGGRKIKKKAFAVQSPYVVHSGSMSGTFEPNVHPDVEIEGFGAIKLVDFPGFFDTRHVAFNFGFISAYKYYNRHAKSCRVIGCTTSICNDRSHLQGQTKELLSMVLSSVDQRPHPRLFISLNYSTDDSHDDRDIGIVQPTLSASGISFGRLALNDLEFEPCLIPSLAAWMRQPGTCTPRHIMTGDPRTEAHANLLRPDETDLMAREIAGLMSGHQVTSFLESIFPKLAPPAKAEAEAKNQRKLSVGGAPRSAESKIENLKEVTKVLTLVKQSFEPLSEMVTKTCTTIRKLASADKDKNDTLSRLILQHEEHFPTLAPFLNLNIPEVLIAAADLELTEVWIPAKKNVCELLTNFLASLKDFVVDDAFLKICAFLDLNTEIKDLQSYLKQAELLNKERLEAAEKMALAARRNQEVKWTDGVSPVKAGALAAGVVAGIILIPAAPIAGIVGAACIVVGSVLWLVQVAVDASKESARKFQEEKDSLREVTRVLLTAAAKRLVELNELATVLDLRTSMIMSFKQELQAVRSTVLEHCRDVHVKDLLTS